MPANFDRREMIAKELQTGQHVMFYKGHEVRFMHISYKCPTLGIYGARDEREIKRLINRELKKRAKVLP